MKKMIGLLIATSLCFAQEMQEEQEKEWKIIANPTDLSIENGVTNFLQKAKTAEDNDAKEKAILKSLKEFVSGEGLELKPSDLLNLKKVRSTQISQLGVFRYAYFNCRFKKTDRGVFFEKTTGSQRKSGLIFQGDARSLIFLGASTVNDEAQREYSGFKRSKNTKHDSAGIIIKRGKAYLMIIPGKNNSFEVYEFQ